MRLLASVPRLAALVGLGTLVGLALLPLVLRAQEPPLAPSFVVDTADDRSDAAPGDGICATAAGECALRAAIEEANAVPGPARITLPAGGFQLAAERSSLEITDDLTLAGAGDSFIIGGSESGILRVSGGGIVQISAIVLTGGFSRADGGALLVDGPAAVTLSDVRLEFNSADRGGAIAVYAGSLELRGVELRRNLAAEGGAVLLAGGSLTMSDSRVVHNEARGNGGGIAILSGAIHVEVVDSAVLDNTAGTAGGGIYVAAGGGLLRLLRSTLEGNIAGKGGGLWWSGADGSIEGSTVSWNTAHESGGGIGVAGGVLALRNATVSSNDAGDAGGGIQAQAGALSLEATTLAANRSVSGGGIALGPDAEVTLHNTLIAANRPTACLGEPTSLGGNADTDGSCRLTAPNDQSGIDADLQPLTLAGGSTETHALGATSEAIDAADQAACTEIDQRGVRRGGLCDIGAYEAILGPTLRSGWNLVGWTGPAATIGAASAALGSRLGAAFGWEAEPQVFRRFAPDAPVFLNSLEAVAPGDALWLFLDAGESIVWPQGPGAPPIDRPLVPGFNLVTWTGPDGTAIADALAPIADIVEVAFTWDPVTQAFKRYSPLAPPVLNTLEELRTGEGVWVRVMAAGVWVHPAP